jgi:hypothetical protein
LTDTEQRPADDLGNQALAAGLRTASLTGVISSNLLWLLQTYVFHGQVPEQLVWTIGIVVPYVTARVGGLLAHRRRLRACQRADQLLSDPSAELPAAEPQKRL